MCHSYGCFLEGWVNVMSINRTLVSQVGQNEEGALVHTAFCVPP